MSSDHLKMMAPLALGACVGIALKTFEQPNEIACVLALVCTVSAYPLMNMLQNMNNSDAQDSDDESDVEISDEETEEEQVVKPTKKRRSRYAAKKLAREANAPQIAREKERKRLEREAEVERVAAEKLAVLKAEAAAAAAAAQASKKRKRKKGKKRAAAAEKKIEDSKAKVQEAPKPVEAAWETVPVRTRKEGHVNSDGEDGEIPSTAVRVEMKVDPKHYGSIIGKGGETLSQIENACQAKITLPKKGMMFSDFITIEGEPAAVQLVQKCINELVKTGYSTITHPDHEFQTIDVARRYHGLVMGRAGCNIRKIQSSTNTRVNMPGKGAGTEITIIGTLLDIAEAKRAIQQLISQGYSDVTHDNWSRCEVPFPAELVSNLVGKGGATIKLLQSRYSVEINTPSPSAPQSIVTILGPQANVLKCEIEVRNLSIVDPADIDPCWGGPQAGNDLAALNSW